jgi:hypothetical protein
MAVKFDIDQAKALLADPNREPTPRFTKPQAPPRRFTFNVQGAKALLAKGLPPPQWSGAEQVGRMSVGVPFEPEPIRPRAQLREAAPEPSYAPYDPAEPPTFEGPGIEYPLAETFFARPYLAAAEAAVPGARRKLLELAETQPGVAKGEMAALATRVEKLPWYKKMPEFAGWTAEKLLEYKILKGLFKATGLTKVADKIGTGIASKIAGKQLATMGGKQALLRPDGFRLFIKGFLQSAAKTAPHNVPFLSTWSASEAARRGEPIGPAAARGAAWGLLFSGIGAAITEGAPRIIDQPTVAKTLIRLQTKYPRIADFVAGKPEQEFVDAALRTLQEDGKIPRGIRFTDLGKDVQSFLRAAGRKIRGLAIKAGRQQAATEKYWGAPGPKGKQIVKPTPPPTIRVGEVPPKPPIVTPPPKATGPEAKAVAQAKRHAVDILPRKTEILREVDEAIKAAPAEKGLSLEKVSELRKNKVDFAINGGAQIVNTKEALGRFRDAVKALPEKEWWPTKVGPKKPTKKKPIEAKRETVGELVKVPEGYFSDGRIVVKGKPPAKAKYKEISEGAPGVSQEQLNDILFTDTERANLEHYAVSSGEYGKGISGVPIAAIGEQYIEEPVAVFKAGDKYYSYQQSRFNVMRNRFPDADYGINPATGALIAYTGGYGNDPVAALMPIATEEGPGATTPPVTMEPLPEPKPSKTAQAIEKIIPRKDNTKRTNCPRRGSGGRIEKSVGNTRKRNWCAGSL